MRKFLFLMLIILATAVISGCSEDRTKSSPDSLALPDEQGKEIVFENMEEPALVFFFTGIE